MAKPLINEKKLTELINLCHDFNIAADYLHGFYPNRSLHPISNLLEELVEECFATYAKLNDAELRRIIDGLHPCFRMLLKLDALNDGDDSFLKQIA